MLRSKVFVSEDRQLQAVHLILDFKPLSKNFQDVGHVIRAGDPWLTRIDILVPSFLAREDLLLGELPLHHSPREVAAPREEIASSCLSLETEIDQFHLKREGEGEEQEEPVVQILDSEGELDKSSFTCFPKLIVAHVDYSSEEEEEMVLNQRKSLKELLAGRNKGTSRSQPLLTLPLLLLLLQSACSQSPT